MTHRPARSGKRFADVWNLSKEARRVDLHRRGAQTAERRWTRAEPPPFRQTAEDGSVPCKVRLSHRTPLNDAISLPTVKPGVSVERKLGCRTLDEK